MVTVHVTVHMVQVQPSCHSNAEWSPLLMNSLQIKDAPLDRTQPLAASTVISLNAPSHQRTPL